VTNPDRALRLHTLAFNLRGLDRRLQADDIWSLPRFGPGQVSELDVALNSAVEDLDALGIFPRLTMAESVPLSPDNLPDVLSDRAGVNLLRKSLRTAAAAVDAELAELADEPTTISGVTVSEHRQLEVIVRVVIEHSVTVRLSDEDRAQLEILVQMLELQLRAPYPDRRIVGRIVRGVVALGGGIFAGVLGNLATDLLQTFDVPWP
jgi:hypothetical protein